MKIEFPALESDALVYFLFHSGAFVLVMALVFFTLGLVLGFLCWGRFKSRAGALAAEAEAHKGEIADLKRKLAEHCLQPLPDVGAAMKTEPAPAVERALPPAPMESAAPLAPDRGWQEMPAMPELEVAVPIRQAPPKPVPAARPRPRTAAVASRAADVGTAAIAPFSFLMDEPGAEPSDTES